MTIVGCDFHPGWQQVAVLNPETGEVQERRLVNGDGEAAQWFEEMLQGMGHEVWIGYRSKGSSRWRCLKRL
jgi:hypothetical protein